MKFLLLGLIIVSNLAMSNDALKVKVTVTVRNGADKIFSTYSTNGKARLKKVLDSREFPNLEGALDSLSEELDNNVVNVLFELKKGMKNKINEHVFSPVLCREQFDQNKIIRTKQRDTLAEIDEMVIKGNLYFNLNKLNRSYLRVKLAKTTLFKHYFQAVGPTTKNVLPSSEATFDLNTTLIDSINDVEIIESYLAEYKKGTVESLSTICNDKITAVDKQKRLEKIRKDKQKRLEKIRKDNEDHSKRVNKIMESVEN